MSRTPDAAACALSEQRLIAADRAARAYCITKKHARAPVYLSQGLPCVASQQPDDAAPASFSVAMPTSLLGTRSPSTRSQTLTTLRKQRPWKSQVRLFVCRSLFGASKDTEYCIREEAQNIFLSWTRKNGVKGFGAHDSNACIFFSDRGYRGLLAQKDIAEGDIIVQVPLRLAIADHPYDEESNQLLHESASWMARLAAHILREKALGDESSWRPYLDILPGKIETPVSWDWERISSIPYEPAADLIHEANWVIESALQKLTGPAIGLPEGQKLSERDVEDFRRACALVQSRTFATASKEGGVGVRVMVPVVDLFNHAGDEVRNVLSSRASACDNCRWAVVAPENNDAKEWVMQVVATCEIKEGDELCFSYGERSNDDFFVHYGFVPLRNPRDEVILFESIESALDWYVLESGFPVGVRQHDEEELVADMRNIAQEASSAMEDRLMREGGLKMEDRSGGLPGPNDPRRLAVRAGSFVTPEIVTMFTAVSGGDPFAAESAVAQRAWKLLKEWGGTGLLADLAKLARHAHALAEYQQREADECSERRYWEFLLGHYHELIRKFCKANGLVASEPPMSMAPGPPKRCTEEKLVNIYAGTSGDGRMVQADYLLLSLMANKRMILWDVLLNCRDIPGVVSSPDSAMQSVDI